MNWTELNEKDTGELKEIKKKLLQRVANAETERLRLIQAILSLQIVYFPEEFNSDQ